MKFDDMMKALGEDRPDLTVLVRKALAGKNNFLAAKAAKVAAEHQWRDLVPDMVKAFDRFFSPKADPQCWAKNAISKALAELEYFDDPQVYIRGLLHVQMEPVWGGQADTAGALRAHCALALVECRNLSDLDVLEHLTDVLVDADKSVRIEAARAVTRIGRREGALLLRLRALSGDPEPEVLGAIFSALLELGRKEAMQFVSRFLGRDADCAQEAAVALGLTHEPEALRVLVERLQVERAPSVRASLLRGIALTRLPAAMDVLIATISSGCSDARAAIDALTYTTLPHEWRESLAGAVRSSGDDSIRRVFEKHFAV